MAGKWSVAAAAVCLAMAASAAATAAPPLGTPDVSTMTLQASDFPGATATGQLVENTALLQAYDRLIRLKSPYGASHYLELESVAILASDTASAAKGYALLGHAFSSKAGRLKLVKQFEKGANVSFTSTKLVKPRPLGVSDSSMEIGFVAKVNGRPLDVSVSLLRLDRVVVEDAAIGTGKAIAKADGIALTKLAAAHTAAALIPIQIAAPTITGTVAQGQTLTASSGTWGDTPTAYTYQWQRCDATGATCADVAGATASTYAVTAADAGATLRVNVTASNRFGSVPASSVVTGVVS
jgi:hypothetical protein